MIPAVPVPPNSKIKIPVDVKLKRQWRFEPERRLFESASGEKFAPAGLPKHTRIVHKVPSLARRPSSKLSRQERELSRYVQVILPAGESPADYVNAVRRWPSVEEAHVAPVVSLP
jgi:hypothetical protein